MKVRTLGNLPMIAKGPLMRLPVPVWRRFVYPLWLRWHRAWQKLPLWREGSYEPGDAIYWRGVKLICCTGHFVGYAAEHPWDPGAGWPEWRAAVLWEPARARDRFLLRLVGDKRERAASEGEVDRG
jgi:hypothetical protein